MGADRKEARRRVKRAEHAPAHIMDRAATLPRIRPSAGCSVAAVLDRQATLFDRVAGNRAALDGQRLGPLDLAAFVGEGTTRMESAARRRVDRARHLARHW